MSCSVVDENTMICKVDRKQNPNAPMLRAVSAGRSPSLGELIAEKMTEAVAVVITGVATTLLVNVLGRLTRSSRDEADDDPGELI